MSNRRVSKIVISALVALDLGALSVVAIHRTSTTTTTHRRPASLAIAPTVTLAPAPPTPTPTPSLGPPSVSPIAPPVVVSVPTAPSTSTPTTPPSSGGSSTPPVVTAAANCPIPLAKPATNGGLQSLITFAPAFGPFEAEAFAMASAYQPVLQLLGPILAQFPQFETEFQPQITALLTPFQNVLNSVYLLIAPFYSPFRQQVLTAETTFASFLAPYAESLANSPLGGCVVDVEAALVGDVQKNSVAKSTPGSSSTSVAGRLTNP